MGQRESAIRHLGMALMRLIVVWFPLVAYGCDGSPAVTAPSGTGGSAGASGQTGSSGGASGAGGGPCHSTTTLVTTSDTEAGPYAPDLRACADEGLCSSICADVVLHLRPDLNSARNECNLVATPISETPDGGGLDDGASDAQGDGEATDADGGATSITLSITMTFCIGG